jgi:heme exporter protein C
MRDKLVYGLAGFSAVLLAWNLYRIFMVLPDELNQGAIWRIFYFHVPAALLALSGFGLGMIFSLVYLAGGNFRYDALAEGVIEVALVFATINLITGSIWARIIWGIWWTWDARLTSMFVCWLIFAGYLMLRRAIEEPTQRARLSAVVSVFGAVDAIIVWKSIEWWRTQHPQPVLSIREGGGMAPGMESVMWWNLLALLCLATVLVIVRMRQAGISREIDSLRRLAHSY